MKNKTISFLLPGAIDTPGGGYKIILEHANHLAEKGCRIFIECPATMNWKQQNLLNKLKQVRIYFKRKYFIGYDCRKWFHLHPGIEVRWIWSLNYNQVYKSDIYIATEVRTSPYLNDYPIDNSRKFYFIQDYENWFVSDQQVRTTYHYPMTKMAIAHWLMDIIEKDEQQKCFFTPNGFDIKYFHITIPIEQKNKYIISMLYHWQERKDIPTALAALNIVKKRIPQLNVLIFGEHPAPELPDWFKYYRKPSEELHLKINNQAAIYVGSSKIEGFGLTVGEAMLCGQAVACTDNAGYKEMAKDGETALLSPVGNPEKLAANIIKLIEDDQLRYKIAQSGHDFIQTHFSWEKAHILFDRVLNIE